MTTVALLLFAIGFSLQAREAVFTRPFVDVAPRGDISWQFQDWSALVEAWPRLGNATAVVAGNWVTGAKAGHALGPKVAVVPLSDPRHFQFFNDGRDHGRLPHAVAIQPVPAGQGEALLPTFLASLEASGFRTTGQPEVIGQRTGDHLRFEIIAIPLENEGDRH